MCLVRWPDAGFFSALCSTFGPFIQSYYESAGHVRDLKLGDLHLIPIPQQQQSSLISSASSPRKDNIADLSLSSFSREITATATNCFIGLLVGQRRHDRQSSRGSIVLDMNSIKKGLLKLRQVISKALILWKLSSFMGKICLKTFLLWNPHKLLLLSILGDDLHLRQWGEWWKYFPRARETPLYLTFSAYWHFSTMVTLTYHTSNKRTLS